MVVRICSQFRPGENIAYEVINGILPIAAIPLATLAIFCSAIPISKNRSGNFSLNKCIWVDSVRSAHRPTTCLSSVAAAKSPSPNPFRRVSVSTSFANNFGFKNSCEGIIAVLFKGRISCFNFLLGAGWLSVPLVFTFPCRNPF